MRILQIINAYENFVKSFHTAFTYERTTPLIFRPDINLSSGEKGMYDLFSSLYDNQFKLQNYLQNTHHLFHKNDEASERCILLLDEPEMGFHPEWKKKFVNSIISVLPLIFRNKQIQILFTTHDPLTLSDIPNSNITYLNKNEAGATIIESNKGKKSFAANISDLLSDSFFLEDGFVGDFAIKRIQETIEWLNDEDRILENKHFYKNLIRLIDEPIVKKKLSQMYDEEFEEELEKEMLTKQIENLNEQLKNLDS